MGPKRQKLKKQWEKTLQEWKIQYRKKKLKKRLQETNKTWEECEQLLKERRSKYADLNLFSKFDEEQHIKALFRGYRNEHLCLLGSYPQPGARPGFKCRFTFEDLEDEYLIELAQFAIEDYNKDAQQSDKLALVELLYYDFRSMGLGDDHLLLVAASNLSNRDIKCYEIGVLVRNGNKVVTTFDQWSNDDIESSPVEEEQTVKSSTPLSGSSSEKGKQSDGTAGLMVNIE